MRPSAKAMNVHLRMLGCRLNQSEIDTMARQFQAQGHTVVDGAAQADAIIVNTCAVTQDAVRSSRKLIREMQRENPNAALTVTGCYAQLAPEEIATLPGNIHIVDNLGKDSLIEQITGLRVHPFDHEPFARFAPTGAAGRTRAFIKVQDGCDNACTFCVTTIARGDGRSRALREVIAEINMLYQLGYQEAVLTGVHLGSYGQDRGEADGLYRLVQAILTETDIPRLRLSSLEPWDLNEAFFVLWQDSRLGRHLHLPLQSGCDATLRRMARRTNQAEFRALVMAAREHIPDVSITTDVIVGFPGETQAEFDISEAFVREMAFSGLHVFRYSKRPGTPAARMKQHVPEDDKKARSARLHALSAECEAAFVQRFLRTQRPVLWEQIAGAAEGGFLNVGYTDHYVRVRAVHPRVLTNLITPTLLHTYDPARGQVEAQPILEPLSEPLPAAEFS